jgi:uncharacterized protein
LQKFIWQRRWIFLLVCLIAGVAITFASHPRRTPATLVITVDHEVLPADGNAEARLNARASDGSELRDVSWQFKHGGNLVRVENSSSSSQLRAGTMPGNVILVATEPGFNAGQAEIRLNLDPTDGFGDGTPDFLRLQSHSDQDTFRRWFSFLAESIYFEKEQDRPAEIDDCAALIRFAYRESLRRHEGLWATSLHLHSLPNVASVQKYNYPHTAIGAGLFRTRPGAFAPEDIADGTFAEFADAETLRRYNTYFVSRDVNSALPGDLLFFRQAGHRMPFHAMIYLGGSIFGTGNDWLVYHTGPRKGSAGEIRRVAITDLLPSMVRLGKNRCNSRT